MFQQGGICRSRESRLCFSTCSTPSMYGSSIEPMSYKALFSVLVLWVKAVCLSFVFSVFSVCFLGACPACHRSDRCQSITITNPERQTFIHTHLDLPLWPIQNHQFNLIYKCLICGAKLIYNTYLKILKKHIIVVYIHNLLN